MRRELAEKIFRKEAMGCAFVEGGYLCFEEDCDAQVALRELMDKKMIQAPVNERFGPGAYEAVINSSVQIHHPEYWQAREKAYRSKTDKLKRKDVSDNGAENHQHDPGESPVCVQPEQPA